jgi:hypothetical protein
MACFPILSLISSVVRRKRDSGAKVEFTWVAAHSTSQELEHVGNRIADFTAKRFCNPNSLNPPGIQPLTLASCYPFVALYNESRLLIGDPRRCCRVVLHSSLKGVWERSRTQSRFSGMQPAASALWHAAVSLSPAHTPLALRILTETVQWMRDEKAPYAAACSHCRHVRDLEHLVQCHDLRRERAGANTAVCRILLALDLPSLTSKASSFLSEGQHLLNTLKGMGIIAATSTAAEIAGLAGAFCADTARAALHSHGATASQCDHCRHSPHPSLLDSPPGVDAL